MSDICEKLIREYFNLRSVLPRDWEARDRKTDESAVGRGMLNLAAGANLAGCGEIFEKRLAIYAKRAGESNKDFLMKMDILCAKVAITPEQDPYKRISSLMEKKPSDTRLDYQVRLFDAMGNLYVMGNNEQISPIGIEIMDDIRKLLKEFNYFPLVSEMGSWGDFQRGVWDDVCDGREVLYRTIPKRYSSEFEKGVLGFRSFSDLRKAEDMLEGASVGGRHYQGKETNMIMLSESFICCFAKSKSAAFERLKRQGGVVYEIRMSDFIEDFFNYVKGRNACDWMDISGLRYYDEPMNRYKDKSFEVKGMAGDVIYGDQDDFGGPSPFVKRTDFAWENEFRIVLAAGPKLYVAARDGELSNQHLTGKKESTLAFVKIGNRSKWWKEIGRA